MSDGSRFEEAKIDVFGLRSKRVVSVAPFLFVRNDVIVSVGTPPAGL